MHTNINEIVGSSPCAFVRDHLKFSGELPFLKLGNSRV